MKVLHSSDISVNVIERELTFSLFPEKVSFFLKIEYGHDFQNEEIKIDKSIIEHLNFGKKN